MSDITDIQWADTTVNPIMGCGGCELFPSPGKVLAAIDAAVLRLHTEPTVEGRRDAWAELVRLHGLRTAETVQRMEEEQGLR